MERRRLMEEGKSPAEVNTSIKAFGVNQVHPGHARYLQIEDMTHGFTVNGKFYDDLVPTVLTWMREQLETGTRNVR